MTRVKQNQPLTQFLLSLRENNGMWVIGEYYGDLRQQRHCPLTFTANRTTTGDSLTGPSDFRRAARRLKLTEGMASIVVSGADESLKRMKWYHEGQPIVHGEVMRMRYMLLWACGKEGTKDFSDIKAEVEAAV